MIDPNWKPLVHNNKVLLGYEISDTGRLRSLDREVKTNSGQIRFTQGKELKITPSKATTKRPMVVIKYRGLGMHLCVTDLMAENWPEVDYNYIPL